ncbi:putative MFS transporter [Favolaschia claudopus]|uniref:MFS transporter n=1 Tax=Favolaschia claudopus TaxID=2862362 RepID=A0AAW0DC29_9AGAR
MSLSSSTEIICVPELLEQILAQLPLRDLLVTAPLVCKAWRSHILFFESDPLAPLSTRVQNQLLAESFAPFFTSGPLEWPYYAKSIMEMPWFKAPDAFRRREASWRRMLVTQPLTQTLLVKHARSSMGGTFERRALLKDLSLCMGFLHDLTLTLIHDQRDSVTSTFRLYWSVDSETRSELTLAVFSSMGCRSRDSDWALDEKFRSEAAISWDTSVTFLDYQ